MPAPARIALPALGLILGLLTACGGGGGGASAPPAPVYTGSQSQAVITAANAGALTQGAVGGAQAGAVTLARTDQAETGAGTMPMTDVMRAMGQLATAAKAGPAAVAGPISGTRAGACGGSATLTGSYVEDANSFTASGTLVANNYCSPAPDLTPVYLNGSLTFSMSGTSQYSYELTLQSPYITIRQGASTWTYHLDYRCTYVNDVAGTETLTAIYRAPDGKTYQVLDYRVTAVEATHTLYITGRFYHPDHGWVDVTTAPGGLVSSWCSTSNAYLPGSGWVRVTGANGTTGTLAPVDCASYQVCYDLNDGTGSHCDLRYY